MPGITTTLFTKRAFNFDSGDGTQIVIKAVDVVPGETLSVGRIIESGLDGSERIVAVGAFNLKAELTKGAGGHGHVH